MGAHASENSQEDHSSSRAAIPSLGRLSPNFVEPLQARALARSSPPARACRAARNAAGVDGGLRRRGDPHGVRPERLEQEAEVAEVLLEGPHLGARSSGRIAVTGRSREVGAASGFSRSFS
jgi:hypothetical protein